MRRSGSVGRSEMTPAPVRQGRSSGTVHVTPGASKFWLSAGAKNTDDQAAAPSVEKSSFAHLPQSHERNSARKAGGGSQRKRHNPAAGSFEQRADTNSPRESAKSMFLPPPASTKHHSSWTAEADPHNLQQLPYYHGLMPRQDIEAMLKRQGDFLVRLTEHDKVGECCVISVKWNGRARHIVLKYDGKHWLIASLTKDHTEHKTVRGLIKYYRRKKVGVTSDGVILVNPVERQDWQLAHSQITLGKKLGEGAFGEVFKGALTIDGQSLSCAVKMLRGTLGVCSKEMRRQFVSEARIMRKYNHDHIVRLLGVAAQELPIMIVMEFAPKGSLIDYLTKRTGKVPTSDHCRFCLEAAKGLAYLESKSCIHRDVAARNCLLGDKGEVKITDFGLSLESVSGDAKDSKGSQIPKPIRWLAPEVLTDNLYSHASDVWAFGVLMWEVFSDGAEPYPGMSNIDVIKKTITDKYHMTPPLGTPEYACKAMVACWIHDRNSRPSFEGLVKMLENGETASNEKKSA